MIPSNTMNITSITDRFQVLRGKIFHTALGECRLWHELQWPQRKDFSKGNFQILTSLGSDRVKLCKFHFKSGLGKIRYSLLLVAWLLYSCKSFTGFHENGLVLFIVRCQIELISYQSLFCLAKENKLSQLKGMI